MYYTVIKHSSHLRTLEKCRKHSPAALAFYISLVFSNACRVLSQCNTRLRLLYLLMKKPKPCDKTLVIWEHSRNAEHSPAARVFYISLVFSNACRVLSQCNTRLRLLYLLSGQHNHSRAWCEGWVEHHRVCNGIPVFRLVVVSMLRFK